MTDDPYEILGVPYEATLPEIEARYRLLLRTYHPDLHHAEGAEAEAEAQAQTQRLTWAMATIRSGPGAAGASTTRRRPSASGPRPRPSSPRPGGQWVGDNPFWRPSDAEPGDAPNDPARPGDPPWAEYDWFGNRIDDRPDGPVPCPFCGRPFGDLASYEDHLERSHHYRKVTGERRRKQRSRLVRSIGWLRFLPPWLVAMVCFGLWRLFGFYVFVGSLFVLMLVLWTQTSPRFRNVPRR